MSSQDVTQQLDHFFTRFQAFSFTSGEILIHSGETISQIFYLKSGVIKQTATSKEGQELIVTLYKTGAFFPLIWAVKDAPVPHDFRAVTNGHDWKAPKDEVIAFLQRSPDVTYDLSLRLLSALEGMSRRTEFALMNTAHLRVCEALVTLAYRFGKKSDDAVQVSFPFTHQELADMTGLTRETVSRELKVLRNAGLVHVDEHTFSIPSLKNLELEIGV